MQMLRFARHDSAFFSHILTPWATLCRPWQPASLVSAGALEWVIWKTSVQLTEVGTVEFVSRAKDTEGQVQPAERDASRLDGYANSWYHRVRCAVV
jgi:hypothetical protein